MNLGIIPFIMSLGVIATCGAALLLGALLIIFAETRPAGWQVIRCSAICLATGLIFAWAGLFVCGIVWYAISENAGVLSLWASGPVGVLFGIFWHAMGWPVGRSRKTPLGPPNDTTESANRRDDTS